MKILADEITIESADEGTTVNLVVYVSPPQKNQIIKPRQLFSTWLYYHLRMENPENGPEMLPKPDELLALHSIAKKTV